MLEPIFLFLEALLGPGYYHIVFEIGLIILVYRLFTTRPKRSNSTVKLLPKERQQLIGSRTRKGLGFFFFNGFF